MTATPFPWFATRSTPSTLGGEQHMAIRGTPMSNITPCKDEVLGHVVAKSLGGRVSPDEEFLTLTEAAKLLPWINSKKVHVSTISRWCTVGLRGDRLKHVRFGRRVLTTRVALLEFFEKLVDIDDRTPPETRSRPKVLRHRPITSRQRQQELAEKILKKAGI